MDILQITSLESDNEYIEAREVYYNDKGERKRGIEVTVKPGYSKGHLRGKVTMKTNLENRPEYDIRVVGRVTGYVTVKPKRVLFRIFTDSADTSQVLTISRPGKPGFRIEEIVEESGIVTWELKEDNDGVYRLKVSLNRDRIDGTQIKGTLMIRTNDSDDQEIEIPIRGFVRDYPMGGKRSSRKQSPGSSRNED
jgi:hypothetical protein